MASAFRCLLPSSCRPRQLWKSIANLTRRAKPQEAGEEPDYYHPGGYHPVSLGDKFHNDRYTILRKLGYGEYSTVWLARDAKANGHVSLKILRADAYNGNHHIFELELLQAISRIVESSQSPGRKHVLGFLDHFHLNGPNGQHVCLVSKVLGCHLGLQADHFRLHRLPVRIVKEVAKQLFMGLDFLHRECGIIHTDLKPTNILLELENPEDAIQRYLSRTAPRLLQDAHKKKAIPLQEVIATPLISRMERIHVRIIDFGVSSWTERHLSNLIQSACLRAPEVTIGAPWGTGVDIWSLGCLMIEFLKGHLAFPGIPDEDGDWSADDHRLAQLISVFGPFPAEFLARGTKTKEFFNEQGALLRHPKLKPVTLKYLLDGPKEWLRRPDDMPKSEVPLYLDFVSSMLVLDPEKRSSAAELLEHEWLRS